MAVDVWVGVDFDVFPDESRQGFQLSKRERGHCVLGVMLTVFVPVHELHHVLFLAAAEVGPHVGLVGDPIACLVAEDGGKVEEAVVMGETHVAGLLVVPGQTNRAYTHVSVCGPGWRVDGSYRRTGLTSRVGKSPINLTRTAPRGDRLDERRWLDQVQSRRVSGLWSGRRSAQLVSGTAVGRGGGIAEMPSECEG